MKYSHLTSLLLMLLVSIAPLTAQDTPDCEADQSLIEHVLGETCVPESVERVVTIELSMTEAVVTLGVQPVGVADVELYNATVKLPTSLSEDVVDVGSRREPNLEVIASLNPDLIVAASWRVSEIYEELSTIAPTITFLGSESLEVMSDEFVTIAAALNRVDEAQQILTDMEQHFVEAASKVSEADLEPGFVLSQTWYEDSVATFRLFTSNAMPVEILTRMGLENDWAAEPTPDGFSVVGIEALGDIGETNFLFLTDADSASFYDKSPLWKSLSFVQAGQAYRLNDELWLFGGPISAMRFADAALESLGVVEAVPADDTSVTATDMLGRTVTLPKPATRIVTLYSEPYAQILALGIVPVGSFGWPGQPLEAAYAPSGLTVDPSVQQISGTDYLPNWELIAALEPDLVIGWGAEEAQTAEVVAPFFGMETYSATKGDTVADYEASLRALAILTGREAEAEAAIAAMQDRIAAYETLAPGDVTVLHLLTNDGQTFIAFNGASINCGMIDRVAECAIEDLGTGRYADLTLEGVYALDPDVILFTGPIFDGPEMITAARAATEAQVLWPELRAVKEGHVHYLPFDTRPDSVFTIGLYLDTIVPLLYPDVFPDGALTDEQVAESLVEES